jgi:2-polyprenyl-3-methyl-5-hydroxy-6-metoxy-1,4-benzoquinol methylase
MNQRYDSKSTAYFSNARNDIYPLLPAYAERVLEVGCGNGATLQALQAAAKVGYTHGLELFEQMASEARLHLNEVTVGNAEVLVPTWPAAQYDLILCLDVLEHLVDPWAFIDQCARLLKPGGSLIASVPNMRTAPVVYKLLFKAQFDYANEGIMDRTHLRWFTKKSALALLQRESLHVKTWLPSPLAPNSKSDVVNRLSFGMLRDWFTIQYLIRADKA